MGWFFVATRGHFSCGPVFVATGGHFSRWTGLCSQERSFSLWTGFCASEMRFFLWAGSAPMTIFLCAGGARRDILPLRWIREPRKLISCCELPLRKLIDRSSCGLRVAAMQACGHEELSLRGVSSRRREWVVMNVSRRSATWRAQSFGLCRLWAPSKSCTAAMAAAPAPKGIFARGLVAVGMQTGCRSAPRHLLPWWSGGFL